MRYNRRLFLKMTTIYTLSTLAPAQTLFAQAQATKNPSKKILPKRLKKGDTIGLTAPGGYITSEELNQAVEALQSLGFKTYYRDNILFRHGYFAGTDQERAEDLMHMFTNKEVDAIMCARGGYGSNRILDVLDFNTIKKYPKIFIGYSDITSLIIAFYQEIGLVGFHGPVAISSFNDFTISSFKKVLMKTKKQYKYSNNRQKNTLNNSDFNQYTISNGKAEGVLIGGNLVMIESLIGTKYEPDFAGKIVFLEEVKEKPYRIDRMLTHLLMATNLSKAAGIVLGIFNDCDKNNGDSFTLKQVLFDRLKKLNIPCFYGMPFGHVKNKITIPVGIHAKMNADKHSLMITEPAVVNDLNKTNSN